MGAASSSQQPQEGEHFSSAINPPRPKTPLDGSKPKAVLPGIRLHPKAQILKKLSHDVLWDCFLSSSAASFALTPSEAVSIMLEAEIMTPSVDGAKKDPIKTEHEVKNFVEHVVEMSSKDTSKSVDFMAVCSSVLLLSDISIETKVDQLYEWIVLKENASSYETNFDEFLVAMSSFERGLSHAMGFQACSEAFVRMVSTQWIALADPKHKGSADSNTKISNKNFFEFCTNRQHIVRKLLETVSVSTVHNTTRSELHEVVDTVNAIKAPASGGDEWMANPAWKKTAERMIPPAVKAANLNAKPTSTLTLEWVHGYRGFDCRNNVFYVDGDSSAQSVLYSAAAVGIVLDSGSNLGSTSQQVSTRTQSHFSEHGDDIISLTMVTLGNGDNLIASGEIGKTPAIYLYSYKKKTSGGEGGNTFQSLTCMKGFHTKGVAQLAFNSSGSALFSIGVDYTVAIYDTDVTHKTFGKMIVSAQGPKDKIMHCCFAGSDTNRDAFLSCGEKHVISWKIDKGTLKQELGKVGAYKNKFFLCATQVPVNPDLVLLSTNEGDLLSMSTLNHTVTPVIFSPALQPNEVHGKNAINTLHCNGDVLVSGGKEGKVIVWRIVTTNSSSVVTLQMILQFNLYGHSTLNVSIVVSGVDNAGPNLTSSAVPKKGSAAKQLAGGNTSGKSANNGNATTTSQAAVGSSKTATPALPSVRSVYIASDNRKVLIGTSTCEILEYTLPTLLPSSGTAAASTQQPLSVRPLVCGHFRDEVWGLAVRPSAGPNDDQDSSSSSSSRGDVEYCTVGDDGYLRFWSLRQHIQLRCLNLKGMARSVAYSPDGTYLAVGFGGRTGKSNAKNKEDGNVKIFRFDSISTSSDTPSVMTLVADIKDAKQWISVVRFSPDSSLLAVGSRDNSIYIYQVNQQFRKKAKFSKHNAGISQLDFTSDGKYLQSCCSGYEILFSDANTGVQITDGATRLLDAPMDSWTCTLGWSVIGIWSGAMDGSDVNAVDRSPSGGLIATSDDFGKVNVFKYPATRDGGSLKAVYNGHSSHVTGVKWISLPTTGQGGGKVRDDYLISTGGEDKCVFQWRNSGPEDKHITARNNEESLSLSEINLEEVEGDEGGSFDAPTGGDEFTAIKPWLGAIVAPTAWTTKDASKVYPFYAALGELSTQHRRITEEVVESIKEAAKKGGALQDGCSGEHQSVYGDVSHAANTALQKLYDSGVVHGTTAPDMDELDLEWVHGYRGFDCRNNVFYVKADDNKKGQGGEARRVVYYAAALGIVLDPVTRAQQYFKGHTDDILSMAVKNECTPDGQHHAVVATGQQGLGLIYVWEVPGLRTAAYIDTKQKSVNMLAFSSDGRQLVSIAEDKTVAVSHWRSGTVLCNTKGEAAVTHHLVTSSVASTQLNFLSCGDKYLRMWSLNGRNLTANKVTAGKTGKIQQYLCATELLGSYYIGCEDGSVYIVKGGEKTVSAVFEHHTAVQKAALSKVKNGLSVTAIYSCSERNLLITGANDGSVVVWDAAMLSPIVTKTARVTDFQVDQLDAGVIMAKQIQSISALSGASDPNQLNLVVSTRGCDILEVSIDLRTKQKAIYGAEACSGDDKVLIRAHCNDELWGVATHPTRPEYCSVGDDKTLRFFNIHTRRMIHSVPLGNIARTVCYNADGSLLAIGFGGRVGKGKEAGGGVVRLYTVTHSGSGGVVVTKGPEKQDAKQWISDVKFSPDGGTLAVAAHDCKVYVYDVTKKTGGGKKGAESDPDAAFPFALKLRSTFTKHNSVLNHIDLSSDGRYMQSNCSAYELLFCDTTTGKQITSATELRDVKWHTWTCTLGWPVQGIWSGNMDGSDINATARSHSGHLLATSDDFGKVNIFRYPCVATGAQPLKYSGHSSHVMNIRWTVGDECLISCGGNDKCLMQWRHTIADVSSSAGDKSAKQAQMGGNTPSKSNKGEDDFAGSSLFDEAPGGGDECGAIKPWLGAIRPPKNPPVVSAQAPAAELTLSWVHGYTSGSAGANNSRISSNLFYNLELNPIYPAAALGVELNRNGSSGTTISSTSSSKGSSAPMTQSYFKGHDDDILCMAISKCRRFVATGQTASKATKGKAGVIVWDANQNRILTRMDSCHSRGVVSLSFNPEGNMLLSVGLDDNNSHNLWSDVGGSWSRVQQLASEKSDKNPVLFSRWVHPQNPMAQSGEYHFLSGGGSGVNFWKLAGSTLSKKQGRFGRKYKQCPLLCAANLQGKESWQMVVGTATGDLYSYSEREVTNSVEKAHSGPVLCMAEGGADCMFLVTGGKDKCVKVWNTQLQPISSFDLTSFSCCDASVASVDLLPIDSTPAGSLVLLVGTYGGEVMELTAKASGDKKGGGQSGSGGDDSRNLDVSNAQVEVMMYSHHSGELWGVATHPLHADIVATVGDDSTLRIWSIKQNKMLKCTKLGWPARCVAWHPQGTMLSVGFHESVKGGYHKGQMTSAAPKKGKKKSVAVAPAPEPSGPKIGGTSKKGASSEDAQENTGTEASDSNDSAGHSGCIHLYSFKYNPSNSAVEIVKRADGCESIAWIADIKFSPDGTTLGASSHDKKLYAFSVPDIKIGDENSYAWEQWSDCLKKPRYVFNKHSSAIVHFDFTLDSKYFQTNCQAGELLFASVADGTHEKSATKLADYNGALEDTPESENRLWASQTCILGWAVQGIWPSANNIQLSDINSTDRHVGNKIMATADDSGLVKLFRAPCVTDCSKFNAYGGHSSHVTNVRWNVENHLISTGGNDKCVFVWQMTEK